MDLSASSFTDKSTVSGFNSEGANSNIVVKHGDPGDAGRMLVFVQCVAMLSVLPGRVVQVSY